MKKKNKSSDLDKASIVNRAGGKLMARGRFAEALSCFHKALDFYGKCGQDRKESLAALNNNTGHAYASLQKPDKALPFFTRAMELRQALGDREGAAWQRANMGSALRDLENFPEAVEEYRQALLIFEGLKLGAAAADQHANLGYAFAMEGDAARAVAHYEKAAEAYERKQDHQRAKACRQNIAAMRGRDLGD